MYFVYLQHDSNEAARTVFARNNVQTEVHWLAALAAEAVCGRAMSQHSAVRPAADLLYTTSTTRGRRSAACLATCCAPGSAPSTIQTTDLNM